MRDQLREESEMHCKEQHLRRLRVKYNELIMAVSKKKEKEVGAF